MDLFAHIIGILENSSLLLLGQQFTELCLGILVGRDTSSLLELICEPPTSRRIIRIILNSSKILKEKQKILQYSL